MTDIIDLSERRKAAERPDGDFVRKDEFGRPLYMFTLSYEFDGATWGAEIWAYSMDDAQGRVAGMRESLTLLGQVFSVQPA